VGITVSAPSAGGGLSPQHIAIRAKRRSHSPAAPDGVTEQWRRRQVPEPHPGL